MNQGPAFSRTFVLAAFLVALAVGLGLRFFQLPERPLGLHYDEAANGILSGEIARGLERPVFIPSYTGKEVLFFYWAALWMRALGPTTLALRSAAASVGLLTIAAAAWATYELLRDQPEALWIAVLSASFLAVSFWHVLLSRYGFRAVTQPLLQALTVAALWHAFRIDPRGDFQSRATAWFLLAGIWCGLTAYTYLAARAFPLPLAVGLVTFFVAEREGRRVRLAQIGIFVGAAVLMLAPLGRYWIAHPGSFMTRANQVAADTWSEAWRGLTACLGMFFVRGDPYIRFNLPGRPLFSPVVALLFLIGLGTAIALLVRSRTTTRRSTRPPSQAAVAFLLALLPIMLLPSALATDEITPSNLRTVGLLPFLYVVPALGLWTLLRLVGRMAGLDGRRLRFLFLGASVAVVVLLGARTARAYSTWSSSAALYYAADGDLADAARYLNGTSLSSTTPYVASRHYRHPTLAFLAESYERVRWLVDGRTLVFPPDGQALILYPRSASEHLPWVQSILPGDALAGSPPGPDGEAAFRVYRVDAADAPTPSVHRDASFGRAAQVLGYTVTNEPRSGERVDVAVTWRVDGPPDQPDYRAVARLVDAWGSLWADAQPLHYPSEQWTEGELVVDHLSIPIPPGAPPGPYTIQFGFYAPSADARLPLLDPTGAYAGSHTELSIEVHPAAASPSLDELAIERRLDVSLDGLTLLGTNLTSTILRPGERLRAALIWQAGPEPRSSRELSLRLGETTLYSGAPVQGTYPFGAWQPGEVVVDRQQPRIPLDTPPGTHTLTLRVEGAEAIELGEVQILPADRSFEVPAVSHPVGITLGGRVELVGYDISRDTIEPGETLNLTLTWRALQEMTTDYTVFTHLLAPAGSMTGQLDRQPVEGRYPTTLWAEGEVITDAYAIPVRDNAQPGEHWLEVGMYLPENGLRLSIDDTPDNALKLRAITIDD